MLEDLFHDLIETLADAVVGVAVTVAGDHQTRREKLAEYEAGAKGRVKPVVEHVALAVHGAVRNRYKDWLADPRLGHEPPAAELRAAEVGLHEAVMALKAGPSVINRALATGASIRLMAITQVLGVACIYDKAATRPAPIRTKRVVKPPRAGDRRMNRRAIAMADIPQTLLPLVARLDSADPGRVAALGEIERHCRGPIDIGGIATRLVALAALAEHQAFIDDLAKHAGVAITQVEPMPASPSGGTVAPPAESAEASSIIAVPDTDHVGPAIGGARDAARSAADVRPRHGAEAAGDARPVSAPAIPATPAHPAAVTPEMMATIKAISNFVHRNRWALNQKNGLYSVGKLGARADLKTAFDEIANHPAMQTALALVAASPPPSKS